MAAHGDLLGYEVVGSGPSRVVVLHDWLCDTSTWDAARAYLDGGRFSYAFVDLRGYGRSRARTGAFTALEAASDVLAVCDALGFARFAVVGHSMSSLIALHLAQRYADRVSRAVLITPPPPAGFGADDAALEGTRALALGDDAMRAAALGPRFGDRLSPQWQQFKLARWRATADAEAVAGYAAMFMRDGIPDAASHVTCPVLAIAGEQDAPPMRRDVVTASLTPLCDALEIVGLADSGHYPMQEMPPLTVAVIERFLAAAR